MGRIFYTSVFLVIAMGLGCAITDYPVIVDKYTGEIVNTNGKALIMREWLGVVIYPDGSDMAFTMVDQKANGDQTLTTYNHYTTDGSLWPDYDYCHPDWTGCAIVTAPNPVIGDEWPYDGTFNKNCDGARSLFVNVANFSRYTECGRAPMTPIDRLSFLAGLQELTPNKVRFDINRRTAILRVDNNAGQVDNISIYGNVPVTVNLGGAGYATIDMTDPVVSNTLLALQHWVKQYQTENTTVSGTINGFDFGSYEVLFLEEGLKYNARR